ncbi:MAG: GNAT family N-acetyltransferase [Bacillaceae bacterium]|nr:GNAT family N-acetyltransferase [Bacillaceae bacterium]
MIRQIDIHHPDRAKEVLHLQRLAYRIEAKWLGTDDIPPLKESINDLQASGEVFYGYFDEQKLVGVMAYKAEGSVLDIHRLMVHPDYFRRGIAGELLQFVEKSNPAVRTIIVSTGSRNEPAKQLYRRHGFINTGEKKVKPGLSLTLFQKSLSD